MGPGRKLLNVRQGDRNIEVYARDFVGVVRQSAKKEACLMFFGGGRPSRALQVPDALLAPRGVTGGVHQPGSAFKRLSLQGSVPWAHRVRSRARSVREPTESAPFREPAQSAPFREPTESAPVREPTEPAPEPAQWPPALPAPPWHPCLPIPPGHGPGPPSLPQMGGTSGIQWI